MLESFFLGNATGRKITDFAYCVTLHLFQTWNGSAQWQISLVWIFSCYHNTNVIVALPNVRLYQLCLPNKKRSLFLSWFYNIPQQYNLQEGNNYLLRLQNGGSVHNNFHFQCKTKTNLTERTVCLYYRNT